MMTKELVFVSVLCFVVTAYGHYEPEQWPFEIADKYVEDFMSQAETLQKTHHYESSQESGTSYKWEHFNKSHDVIKDDTKYDFIIVGGGTSGAVLANRLSEVPEWKVLVLEAGGYETKASQIPSYWKLLESTPLNWAFTTVPQNYSCLAMTRHECAIPSGRALGGSTTINSMVYTRGNARDYDLWSDRGDHGWCYEEVLPYLKRIEDAYFDHYDHKFHHRGGPQTLQTPQFQTHLFDDIVEAGKALDLPLVDYNGKHQIGIGLPQLTTNHGRRFSTAQAYLTCDKQRPNLIIKPLTQALKLVVSYHTKDTKGVLYHHNGKIFEAYAAKEVILAGGAVNTAKILLQSGIGPKEECDKHKIEQLIDLKVGHHLRANPVFLGLDFVKDSDAGIGHHMTGEHFVEYLRYGRGPLTSPGIEAVAFVKSELAKSNLKYPDIELQFSLEYFDDSAKQLKSLTLSHEHFHDVWKTLGGKHVMNVAVILRHPESIGYVTLRSNNPFDLPLIDPQLLCDLEEHDLKAMLSGIRKVLKLAHTGIFKKHGFNLNQSPVLGCEKFEFDSDEYWTCAIKFMTGMTRDVSGTARMGQEDDHEAVVDHHLKVYGVNNLRIADSSVIPVHITGGLTAATMLIGEKAADLIKKDWH